MVQPGSRYDPIRHVGDLVPVDLLHLCRNRRIHRNLTKWVSRARHGVNETVERIRGNPPLFDEVDHFNQ